MTLRTLSANRSGNARTETLMGREYRVLPVRMIRQGVLVANKGPLFYSRSEIARTSQAWNNIPIVVDHPKDGDRFISARSPDVLNKSWIGFVFNARMNSDSLDAEAWIDVERVSEVDPALKDRINRAEPVEVSTGLGTEEVPQTGTYNSKRYTHRAINLAPDHLAVLPYDEGACSLRDGCGLAVNAKDADLIDWVTRYEFSGSSEPFSFWQFTANCGGNKSCDCQRCNMDFQPSIESFDFQPTSNSEEGWKTLKGGAKVYIGEDGLMRAGGPEGEVVGGKSKEGGSYKGTARTAYATSKKATAAAKKGNKAEALKLHKEALEQHKKAEDLAARDHRNEERHNHNEYVFRHIDAIKKLTK